MSKNQHFLDWRADDDAGWEEMGPAPAGTPPRPKRHLWLTLLCLLVAAGFLTMRHLQQQVTIATHNAESDLLATHNLLLQAILEQDQDLFLPSLSQKDIEWWRAEQELFAKGQLLDRAEWGFPLANVPPAGTQISLSPDLQQAEVTFNLSYAFATDRTFDLAHTFTYHLEDGRWVLIRPEDSFWGPWITRELTHFSLIYPIRDQALGDRLANDLQNILNEVCGLIECSSSVQIQLRLERFVGTLTQSTTASPITFMGRTTLSLPAPSLWGQPLTETGYQMLLQSYATQLTSFLLAQQKNGYSLPDSLTEATIQRTLVDLGLLTWPPLAHLDNPNLPAAIANRSLYLLCTEDEQMGLYRFNLGDQTSVKLYADPQLMGMLPVTGDDGLFLYRYRDSAMEVLYYRPGQAPSLLPEANAVFSGNDWDISRPVIGYEANDQFSFALFEPAACTPAGCQLTPFPSQIPFPSPNGSRLLLYDVLNSQISLSDPAGATPTPIAFGYQPFWIDENNFGFLQFEGRKSFDAPSQLLLTDLESGQTAVIIDKNDLIRIGLEDGLPLESSFLLSDVTVNPLDPLMLLVTVVFFQDQNMSAPIFQRVIYRYWRDSGRLEMVKWFNNSEMDNPTFSPNGQWFVAQQEQQHRIELYELDNNEQPILSLPFSGSALPKLDWLPGRDWLLFLSNGLLTLANPAEKVDYVLPAPAGCADALWAR